MEMDNMCRTCLRIPDTLVSLFDDALLPHKIAMISSIRVYMDDNLPKKICEECLKNINLSYNFRKVIINSDLELRERYAAIKNERLDDEDIQSLSTILEVQVKSEDIVNVETESITVNNDTLQGIQIINESKSLRKEPISAKKDQATRNRHSFKNMIMYRKKSYECKACNFTCIESSKWQNHKRTKHYAPGVCNICGKTMRTDNLHKHIKSHTEDPVTCNECGKIFKNTESLRSHSLIHNSPELLCKLCGKSYKYRGEYNRHIKRHSLNGVKTVKCPVCEKLFHDKKHIKKHMQTHTGERPHVCQYCQKGFSSSYALKTHVRQHTNEKPFICEYCPMAFPQKVSLMTHIKSKHMNSKIENM